MKNRSGKSIDLHGFAPHHGVDCSEEYVEAYKQSHAAPENLEYRLAYYRNVLIDGLLRNYSYLDAGCGTAGYFRLMRNASHLTGIDYSQNMITAARELAVRYKYEDKTEFIMSDFASFQTEEKYDAVRLGVYGSFLPASIEGLKKAHTLLNPGGLLMISITPPRGLRESLKDRFGRTQVRISPTRFVALLERAGGLNILSVTQAGQRFHYLIQRSTQD